MALLLSLVVYVAKVKLNVILIRIAFMMIGLLTLNMPQKWDNAYPHDHFLMIVMLFISVLTGEVAVTIVKQEEIVNLETGYVSFVL